MALPLINVTLRNTLHAFEENGRLLYKYLPFQNLKVETTDGSIDLTDLRLSAYMANIDVNQPVSIDTEVSYDSSTNLIVNDYTNPLKLVNSRFYLINANNYKIADRKGNLDTNIYTEEDFKIEAGLIKTVRSVISLDFLGIEEGGLMPVGSYNFYFKLADSDGNESDFVSESGKVVCHIGAINQPTSIRGGQLSENSDKVIKFRLNNLDLAYDYINIYYTKHSGDSQLESFETYRITDKFKITGVSTEIFITGYENHEQINESEINMRYAAFDSVKTNENCQDITFAGNVTRNYELFKILEKYSLRIVPRLSYDETIGNLNYKYEDNFPQGGYEYYNVENIYYKLGLWDKDIYRVGIVYILNDYTLSPVFNIRGIKELSSNTLFTSFNLSKEIKYGEDFIFEDTNSSNPENAKGIFKVKGDQYVFNASEPIRPIGLKFEFTEDVVDGSEDIGTEGLKHLTRGFFFVRQKRIPTLLTQAVAIGTSSKAYIPVIKGTFGPISAPSNAYFSESFLTSDSGKPRLQRDFFSINSQYIKSNALLCPEATLKPYIYNNYFNSSEFTLRKSQYLSTGNFVDHSGDRTIFSLGDLTYSNTVVPDIITKLSLIEPGIELINNETTQFSSRAGNALEAWSHLDPIAGNINELHNDVSLTDDQWSNGVSKVRGEFNSYIGSTYDTLEHGQVYDIFQKNYDFDKRWKNYFKVRYNDSSPFMAISDRFEYTSLVDKKTGGIYRGDCYINTYTHRINWNFIDPELPTNNKVVDPWTWYKNYRVRTTNIKVGAGGIVLHENEDEPFTNTIDSLSYKKVLDIFTYKNVNYNIDVDSTDNVDLSTYKITLPDAKKFAKYSEANGTFGAEKINRPDVNAVGIGHWVTFKICSNINLSMRDIDFSRPEEEAVHKMKRNFHPLQTAKPTNKLPESSIINSGISKSLSDRYYFEIPDVPFIKDSFTTRIHYSNILQESSFRNGHRIFKAENYQDYTLEHGELVKLVDWFGKLVAVMEHGVLMIPVNERAMVTNEMGENVYINTDTVLPKNPKVLSNTYGSVFADSVIKTPMFIYGIDTIAKKIWRTNGDEFKIISDLKIQRFLNDNIHLKSIERDRTPGLYGIKTHFNAFKNDVMFVFKYGDIQWNLCWNEMLDNWVTRYSWFPEFSENINNIFYTFANKNIHENVGHILYKHGFAGSEEELGNILPTKWYDYTYTFEFEFVVIGVQGVQKIFDNLKIISNSTKPLEFYYEIVGSGYDWETLKDDIYGIDSDSEFQEFLEDYPSIPKIPYIRTIPNFTETTKAGNRDITLEKDLKTEEILISSYQKGIDIKTSGRVKGNMEYMEDFWDIQIQPLTFKYAYLTNGNLALTKQEESKIRDKYIKIRVKYDGTKYAIINAIKTFFTISYA